MNQDRRKKIGEAKSILEYCRDEEQEAFDNMPEGLQQGEKGEASQTAIDQLEEAINALESVE